MRSNKDRAVRTACLVVLVGGLAPIGRAQIPTDYPLLSPSARPQCITAGPDGNLWFAERNVSKIGRITTKPTVLPEFSASGMGGGLTLRMQCITAGPDGAMWFTVTETTNGQIGRITTAGGVTMFPTLITTARLYSITAGPASDGALWFTEAGFGVSKIGRITTAGVITHYPTPTPTGFFAIESSITLGPDGNLWFTESDVNKIGRLDPTKLTGCDTAPTTCITEFTIPTPGTGPAGITAGPPSDGALWFTEKTTNKIGRITTAGVVTGEFPVMTGAAGVQDIIAGPDGNIWFTEETINKVGKITTAGIVTEYSVTTPSSQPEGITKGSDGNIWFTEFSGNKIGRVALGGGGGTPSPTPTLSVTPTPTPTGTSSGTPRGHITPIHPPPPLGTENGRQ